MEQQPSAWKWQEGIVDRNEEHLEIRYGSIGSGPLETVALIGKPRDTTFTVQFLMEKSNDKNIEILNDVVNEINFYLVEKNEPDPWAYVKYHCGSSANAYSNVHWRCII